MGLPGEIRFLDIRGSICFFARLKLYCFRGNYREPFRVWSLSELFCEVVITPKIRNPHSLKPAYAGLEPAKGLFCLSNTGNVMPAELLRSRSLPWRYLKNSPRDQLIQKKNPNKSNDLDGEIRGLWSPEYFKVGVSFWILNLLAHFQENIGLSV